ncbi:MULTISPECIES: hypothetical protein [Bacillus amyloliquefaciens group]|uniref:hypothetical protein n=1 Tax=Bacillus amyloliquefaciens group TaxID=1938374 RepID=UPI0021B0D94E|nr:hypothetical protein [Bacillus velezensis]MCT6684549.1 hypothetical protein [Bacillus velezensis]MCY0092200.1 hypothetical protein [Bacillus velezensis]MEC0383426.1 hypothetical protein [Bacillus velezensis]MEC0386088.1 hypothetical protein [Bacillus velezensis]
MIKTYTTGHKIPEKIKSCIKEWNYWTWIVVANTAKGNKDAKRLIEKIEADPDKVMVYSTEEGIDVFVSYMDSVK